MLQYLQGYLDVFKRLTKWKVSEAACNELFSNVRDILAFNRLVLTTILCVIYKYINTLLSCRMSVQSLHTGAFAMQAAHNIYDTHAACLRCRSPTVDR